MRCGRMAWLVLAFLGAWIATGPAAAASFTFTRTNYTLTVTPTGPTLLTIAPGATFSIAGSWSAAYNGIGCAGCPTQLYLHFFAGAAAPGDPLVLGQINLFDSVDAPVRVPSASGRYAGTFTAPTRPDTYYISGIETLNFPSAFSTLQNAGFSTPDPWAYLVTVPAAPAAVPGPASLLVLGTGLLGLAAVRRRPAPG